MTIKPALLALLGGLVLTVPAYATPTKKPAAAPKAPNCGEKYVVGKDTAHTTLTQEQIDSVMKTKVGEVEACWTRLPVDKRKRDVAAVLNISVDDAGEVQTVTAAALPDDVQRCIALAAVAWTFPQYDNAADALTFTYPVALRAK